jgi:magnesium-transporting ATPase (P-type)
VFLCVCVCVYVCTGTLTTSRMTVTKVYVGGKTHDIANVASVGLQDSVKDLLMKASVINTMSKTNLKGPGDKGKKSDPVYQGKLSTVST